MARRQKPFTVIPMQYDAFYDLKGLSENKNTNFTTDRDGNKVNWLKVKKVSKNFPDDMKVNYEQSDNFRNIQVSRIGRGRPSMQPSLRRKYSKRSPISQLKKRDLLDLCNSLVIPAMYRSFYEDMPTSKAQKDRLPVPDVLDEESDYETECIL